jgi:hypothetical protein
MAWARNLPAACPAVHDKVAQKCDSGEQGQRKHSAKVGKKTTHTRPKPSKSGTISHFPRFFAFAHCKTWKCMLLCMRVLGPAPMPICPLLPRRPTQHEEAESSKGPKAHPPILNAPTCYQEINMTENPEPKNNSGIHGTYSGRARPYRPTVLG